MVDMNYIFSMSILDQLTNDIVDSNISLLGLDFFIHIVKNFNDLFFNAKIDLIFLVSLLDNFVDHFLIDFPELEVFPKSSEQDLNTITKNKGEKNDQYHS